MITDCLDLTSAVYHGGTAANQTSKVLNVYPFITVMYELYYTRGID